MNGNLYEAKNTDKCEFILKGSNQAINLGTINNTWDQVFIPTANQPISGGLTSLLPRHYYFYKPDNQVELRVSSSYISQNSDHPELFIFYLEETIGNRGMIGIKANCDNNSLSADQLEFASKYDFLKKTGDHVRVYENGQMVTYNSDGTVKVTAMTQIQFNQKLANLKAGLLHDGVATIYEKTSSGYKVHLNYGKDVLVKEGYEENGTAKDKSEQLIEEKLNALLANVPDLEVLRQGAESGVFNDGKKIVIKDLPWYEFAFEIINSGRQFLRDAEIPENYWNSANAQYAPNWLNTPPYVTGVGNGIIEELKSIPMLIDFGIEIATNEPLRTKTWNSMKDLSWQDIKDGLYNQVTSTIDTLLAGTDNSWHSGGKITVEVASMFFGVGFIKKGADAAKDVVAKNIDDIAEEVEKRAAKKLQGEGKFSITKLDDYLKNISTRNPAGAVGSPPRVYQESVTTGIEYELKGGANSKIWADGLDKSTGTVIEAKYISNPSASPFVEGSSCYPPVRQKILDEVTDEFRRYADIIKDPNTPLTQIEIFVSDASGVPYFQKLLNDFSIPGKVTGKP